MKYLLLMEHQSQDSHIKKLFQCLKKSNRETLWLQLVEEPHPRRKLLLYQQKNIDFKK